MSAVNSTCVPPEVREFLRGVIHISARRPVGGPASFQIQYRDDLFQNYNEDLEPIGEAMHVVVRLPVTDATCLPRATSAIRDIRLRCYQAESRGDICGHCGRELDDGEHVTLCRRFTGSRWQGKFPVCDPCFRKPTEERRFHFGYRRYNPEFHTEPRERAGYPQNANCENCGRPTQFSFEPLRQRLACSSRCRQALRDQPAKDMRAEREFQCKQCGEPYKPTRADSRFCSDVCRQRASRERRTQP